ncbi:MAG: FAD-dependent oxidoreductase, partial [Beijerinckiaceae bacterium]|nr:FAD-dependent oxidoreductase [Beijerinckiaceae bacterium]
MMEPAVHVIGAGLAGLAAAVRLAGGPRHIVLHEAARQAGGRCRSYYDPALGMTLDNGNHLLLSGNHDALCYLAVTGGEDQLGGPPEAEFAFADLASGERWRLRPNKGRLPWWIFSPRRRVPGTTPSDYFSVIRLLLASRDAPIGMVMRGGGAAYERLWRPFFLAALNTDPEEGSAHLAAAVVWETLSKGGRACQPLVAANGLSAAFVDPALSYLERHGAKFNFDHRLRAIEFANGRAVCLDFGEVQVRLSAEDRVVLAVPPQAACGLVPGLQTPKACRAIVNAHFRIPPPRNLP